MLVAPVGKFNNDKGLQPNWGNWGNWGNEFLTLRQLEE